MISRTPKMVLRSRNLPDLLRFITAPRHFRGKLFDKTIRRSDKT
jgi:hypothetical protein